MYRAITAVARSGTRVSQDVYQKVLVQGQNYSGRVFVVNNWYIGSYEPLRDFRNNVVGMMYVGVRETIFESLVVAFNTRAAWIAFVCILVAGVIAIPIARLITRPIAIAGGSKPSPGQGGYECARGVQWKR